MLSIEGIERLIEPLMVQLGLALYNVELKREGKELVLRITADRADKSEGGVTVDELAHASDEVGALLDLEDPIEERYRLTLESPGIERELQSWRHFRFAIGERVRVTTRGEEATVYEGVLETADDETRMLGIRTAEGIVPVDSTKVKSARTVFVWSSGEKRKF
ncbi:MAG: hypothetical protein IKY83_05300 [Proteobacteria bacterium]|nr:hypothetical protein [Pseudomonadota bacterium]